MAFYPMHIGKLGDVMYEKVKAWFVPIVYVLIFFGGFFTAHLWFHPQAYFSQLPQVILALCALALVWLAIVIGVYKVRADIRERQQAQLIKQESVYPVLHAAIQRVEDRPEMLVLAVRNYGKGVAKNIRFGIDAWLNHPASEAIAIAINQLPVFANPLDALAVDEIYGGIFGDSNQILQEIPERAFSGVVKLRLDFENILGDVYHSETVLDLSLLNDLNELERIESYPHKRLFY